ncbi:hypothetical protein CXY01_03940 [Cellulomonas xylanilytica]|uniref:ApeA N-terminal domain-containing protein n=2 Tax=Cellulomonas xylanilytica TaxID=233583 RepID=A0A510UYY5_9CELL|nr:hypothetical protein CXY01_03940 [Cellulomonas xylanilytica]
MTMDIGETHHTRWFHPGRDEKDGAPGSYRVDEDGHVEVHIFETFDGEGSLAFMPDESVPDILLGEVFREAVTLIGCRSVGGKTGVTSQQDIRIRPQYAIEGSIYLTSEDELRVTSLRLRFTDQDAWTNWKPFSVEKMRKPEGLESASVTFSRPADLAALVDGGRLSLIDDSYVHEDTITHRTELQAQSRFEYVLDEPVPIHDAMSRYGYPLQVLLLTATGQMPGAISVRATNPAWVEDVEVSAFQTAWVTLRRFHGGHAGLAPNSLSYLHRLEDFDFAVQLPRVLASVTKHRLAFERYAEMLSKRGGGDQSQFVNLTQVIDAYDRSNHPGEKRSGAFYVPVERMDLELDQFISALVDGTDRWGFYVGKLRNIVLHGDPRARELVADPRPLHAAFEALSLLFEASVLVGFGFTVARARELVEARHPFWARAKNIKENFPALIDFVGETPPVR